MKLLFTLSLSLLFFQFGISQAVLTAVFDGPLPGGTPKGVEIYLTQDIADLSLLGVSSANNGSGPTGTPEYTLPAGSGLAGQYIYIASEAENFEMFFEFEADYVDGSGSVNINGDDAVELFYDGAVIDVFGDVNTDGTGTPWEHLDGWAARLPNTGPDGATFEIGNWQFSGVDALDGETTNATAATPVPLKSYTGGTVVPDHTVTVINNVFQPSTLVVDVNDVVEWDCTQGTHNVNGSLTAYPNNTEDFTNGPAIPAPWTFQHNFTNPGINDYHCDPHLGVGMTGKVMVREEGDHYVEVVDNDFIPKDITIELGETVVWTNVQGIHNANGSTNVFPNNPEGFSSGAASTDWTYAHTFTIAGTYDYQCDPHVSLGMVGTVTVVSAYEPLDMATVKQVDGDGLALYQDSLVQVSGVVHGPNYRSSGIEFFLIDDNNNGVMIRTTSSTPAYTVTEGDELTVSGVLDQFNGLIQLIPDVIDINSTGNPFLSPKVVTVLSEDTEGAFIKVENLMLVDTAEWPDPGQSRNVFATNGSDTILIRIDSDIDFDVPVPMGPFDVTGLGSQFDSSLPYTEGYQILPRSGADIMEASGVVSVGDVGVLKMYPNPVDDVLTIESEAIIRTLRIFDMQGRLVTSSEPGGKLIEISLANLNSGTYLIQLETQRGIGASTLIKK